MYEEYVREWENQKIMQGEQIGMKKDRVEVLFEQLAESFGPESIDNSVKERLRNASMEELKIWTKRIIHAKTIDEVFSSSR
jgi:hypothetical protein